MTNEEPFDELKDAFDRLDPNDPTIAMLRDVHNGFIEFILARLPMRGVTHAVEYALRYAATQHAERKDQP